MAVNLLKNKESMQQAWKDIVDDNKPTKWAVFGYDGKTFDLKLISTGEGDLEEMTEELNSGKIMYAVCRVIDPKTSLPKFVMINWQGEGAPGDRKGKCANHVRDVGDFFKGIHITVTARTEDDVEPSIIVDKVSKSTGSAYSFKDRAGPLENHTPVSSVYKRIVPTAEINSRERDKFWEKQEVEEKLRVEEERKRLEEASAQIENERHRREVQDAQRRDEFVKQRTKVISEIRAAESTNKKIVVESEKKRWQKQMEDDAVEEEKRLKQNESKRLERNYEVESLIGQRTLNARAVFEQNTVVGQMSSMKSTFRTSNQVKTSSEKSSSSNGTRHSFQDSDSSLSSHASYGKHSPDRTPPSPEPESAVPSANRIVTSNVDTSHYEATRVTLGEEPEFNDSNRSPELKEAGQTLIPDDSPAEILKDEEDEVVAQCAYANVNSQEQEGESLCVRALYDYQAADETEISFNPDDIITHVNRIDEGWWQGLAPDGTYGLFPANYVEIVE